MDLIDRDAAIKAVATELAFHSYAGNIAANAIKSVPSAEKRGKWEEVNQIIDQSEYELLDGIGMPYHARTFSAEEFDTIKGVVEYIRKAFESEE